MDINWNKIQKYYDDGHTWDEIVKEFKISKLIISNAVRNGKMKTRTKSESGKLSHKKNPRKHSIDTKNKISISIKNFLTENPDKVPYLLNHNSKRETYPEKYFDELFSKYFKKDDDYIMYQQVSYYEIDFAFVKKWIAIEIDGSQHKYDKKIVESDNRKNLFLQKIGWKVIRIIWSSYQSLDYKNKENYIEELISYIKGEKDSITKFEYKENNKCVECGKDIEKSSLRCKKCDGVKRSMETLKRIPSYDELKKDVDKYGYSFTGMKNNVSGNMIKKWLNLHNKYKNN